MKILTGDCLDLLPSLETNSVHSLVTDVPASISFMSRDWDSDRGGREEWVAWLTTILRECLRVLRPGGHALVWALPRRSHWTATAIEDSGFEIRDIVSHLFGQGFPKSHDVSKAIDKLQGEERERIRGVRSGVVKNTYAQDAWSREYKDSVLSPVPITDEAAKWQGFGSALKPAVEFYILARKPLQETSIAANVLKWGCGALNIDACRAGSELLSYKGSRVVGAGRERSCNLVDRGDGKTPDGRDLAKAVERQERYAENKQEKTVSGRHPANLILSHSPECSQIACEPGCPVADLGSAARYFYCAKASRGERNRGCETLPVKSPEEMTGRAAGSPGLVMVGGKANPYAGTSGAARSNHHPTVKSVALMRYLCRLITPPGGIVLDPFLGSGTTAVAALQEGFDCIGMELDSDYVQIANARIAAALST